MSERDMSVESRTVGSEEKNAVVEPENEVEVKKEPVLAPAPLPTKSPWKSVSVDIPVSSISVESLESGKKKKKNKAVTPAISSSTKWVPMKASIVVSGPKRAGSGARKGNNKNAGGAGSKKKKQQQGQQSARKQSPKATSVNKEIKEDEIAKVKEDQSQQDDVAEAKPMSSSGSEYSTVGELPSGAGPNGQHGYQRRKHNHSSQFQHSAHQQNGFQRRRYYNNYNSNDSHKQQRYSSQPKGLPGSYQGRIPRSFGNSPHLINDQMQKVPYMVPVYQQYYSMQPILMAVNSIARQIEYYFSPENLAKDKYLRSKLSKEGYAPVSLIAKFYRVVNMSFGGDPTLILAALREIVHNQNATVDVCYGSTGVTEESDSKQDDTAILANYFVRSKEWETSLPEEFSTVVEIERVLQGDALDEFMISASLAPSEPANSELQETVPVVAIPENSEEENVSSTSNTEEARVEA